LALYATTFDLVLIGQQVEHAERLLVRRDDVDACRKATYRGE
jgi:hypothetical protein